MKKILLSIITILLLVGCSSNQEKPEENQEPQVVYNQQAFPTIPDIEDEYIPPLNTMVNLKSARTDIDSLMIQLEPILTKGHKLFDGYHYYRDEDDNLINNIRMINDHYNSGVTLEIDPELAAFLNKVLDLATLTHGYFNPFMGAVINLYDGKFSPFPNTNTDPDAALINEALKSVVPVEEMRNVLKIEGDQLTFNAYNDIESVILNVGGASKGQVANDLYGLLKEETDEYLLDIGSSNLLTNSQNGVLVGVRSPYNKIASIYSLHLKDGLAMSTSGDDNNYYLLEDDPTIVRSHILNPFTGYSENYYRSVSVLSDDSMIADVLTTALFNVEDIDEIVEIVEDVKAEFNVRVEFALLKETDQTNEKCDLYLTKGFKEFLIDDYVTNHIENIYVIGE